MGKSIMGNVPEYHNILYNECFSEIKVIILHRLKHYINNQTILAHKCLKTILPYSNWG